jgi:cellulose synthase/poly-beta-1,6-N-acetylglucosamine synthase-like glycosyltransferase
MNCFIESALGTVGKRIYAVILLVAIGYLTLHLTLGLRLVLAAVDHTPFVALGLSITIITALAGTLQVAENLGFCAVLLLRGPRPLVAPPKTAPDASLPLLIVQIPGRNEPLEEVRRSIDSVLNLDYPADHIRVQHIDNSDDQRWREVMAAYQHEPRIEVLHRDGTAGFKAGNLNVGTKRLIGQNLGDPATVFVGLLDVGDTFARDCVRLMTTEFLLNDKLAFVQATPQIRNPDDTLITKAESHVATSWWRFCCTMQGHYSMPSIYGHHVIVRLAALQHVGGWDETKVAEDWSTSTRMLVSGWQGKFVDYGTDDPNMISGEMTPLTLEGQQKQKGKWATGGTELMRASLAGWLRSSLPWHYRFGLLIRLTSFPTASFRLVGHLLAPMWVVLAGLMGERSPPLAFALLSASLQSTWLVFYAAFSITYAREGNISKALGMLVFVPVQMVYTLPIMPHILHGVYKGLRYAINAFVVTPKRFEYNSSIWRLVVKQRMAFVMAALFASPSLLLPFDVPGYVRYAALWMLFSSLMTVLGVLLVPVTQWWRGR